MRYYLLNGILYFLSLLPLRALYFISDILFILCYHVVKYRRKVVRDNITYALPQLSSESIYKYELAFYRHFCDVIVETVKSMSISQGLLRERVLFTNPGIAQEIMDHPTGSILISTHYGNFEWMAARLDIELNIPTYGIYTPLKDKAMDRIIGKMRNRFGMQLIPMHKAMRMSIEMLREQGMIGFICDQSPSREPKLFFGDFLGRPTATHMGPSKLALKLKKPIYFSEVKKLRRGHYSLTIHRLPLEEFLPYSLENVYRLTEYHMDLLANEIKINPPYWLWSHRRWKHQPQPQDDISMNISK